MENYIGVKLDGRYELLELIGSGGMAEIYKADDIVENRTVAVKILKNEFAGSEDFLRRFRNESKAIALLSHPNIVKIFDVGFTESVQFIVMEYIGGITLTEYIEKQGVLKWREALGFVLQILKALQHAHDRGIVHRDIKSQNVMLLKDNTIKVMDFGIARFNREIDKTISEKAIGSVHYISPEQARGDITDEKSDLYSVGIMLYEMLTGVKPFDGDDPLSIALMHTNKSPKRPCEINSSIPEGLEEITLRAMQKEPAMRYQTAGEMVSDLTKFERNPSVIFEYKYFTPDGNTKFFDKVGKPAANPSSEIEFPPANKRNQPVAISDEPYGGEEEDGEYDDYDDDEVVERRSPLLPILFAVASVFVILAAWLIFMIVSNIVGDDTVDNPDSDIVVIGNDVVMPQLVAMMYNEAVASYGDYLLFNPEEKHSSEYPKGAIMEQSIPAQRQVKKKTQVDVVVSLGPNTVYLDDYSPLTGPHLADDVVSNLKSAGLEPRKKYANSEDVPKEYVIETDPPAGTKLEKGDTVTVWVSLGSENSGMTKVPDLLNLSLTQARVNANEYRVTLKETYEESDEDMKGKVIRQSIDPDAEVEDWSEVEVFIGSGEPAERESSIGFDVGSTRSGDYVFLFYRDGVQVESKTIDVGLQKNILWEFSDSEVHTYSMKIRSVETGLEAYIVSYEIDFTTDPPTKQEVIAFNKNAFKEIAETTTEATSSETTTSSTTANSEEEPGENG